MRRFFTFVQSAPLLVLSIALTTAAEEGEDRTVEEHSDNND